MIDFWIWIYIVLISSAILMVMVIAIDLVEWAFQRPRRSFKGLLLPWFLLCVKVIFAGMVTLLFGASINGFKIT